jgi:hypothetical protein
VPLNAPGVSIWSRKPYERYVVSEFDNPLAARFDETDSAVLSRSRGERQPAHVATSHYSSKPADSALNSL